MKRTLFTTALLTVLFTGVLAAGVSAQDTKWLSSYWDGCKPTCSWFQNVPRNSEHGLSKSCGIDDNELFLGDIAEAKCAKDGGPAYTCWDQTPFVDPGNPLIAYGFGATSEAACGECFEVTFTGGYEHGPSMPMHTALASASSGKKVVIMGRNTGGDVAPNQIDFMIPGGGLGQYDCFTEQLGFTKNDPILGLVHGGLLARCIDQMIEQFGGIWSAPGVLEATQACHRAGCNEAFGAPEHAVLLEGCLFHVDWMMSAPNPLATVKKLDSCPQILVDGYKPRSSKYSVIVKGVNFTSSTGGINVSATDIHVNGLNSQHTLTFNNVTAPHTGEYTLLFSVSTELQTTISAAVNGQPAGSTSDFRTAKWGEFETVPLSSKVNLVEGTNTITLSFNTYSVNFDYFILIGEEQNVSIKFSGARGVNTTRSNVVLRPANRGFSAILPNNHTFESYSLIDLRGREIRSGAVRAGAAELNFNNVRPGVVFLRLKDKFGTSTTLRAVTF